MKYFTIVAVLLLLKLCDVTLAEEQHKSKSYSPTDQVKEAHRIPHLGWDLHRKSNTFRITTKMETNSYSNSLIVLPIVIFVIIAGSVVLFQVLLLLRALSHMCCACSKFWINMVYKCLHKTKRCKRKYINQRYQKRRAKVLFVIFVFASVVGAGVVFDGDGRVNLGVRDMQGGFGYISVVAGNIGVSLDVMVDDANVVSAYLEENACPRTVSKYLEDVSTFVDNFNAVVDEAIAVTASVSTGVDVTNSYLEEYAIDKKGMVVVCFFVGVVALVLMFALSAACKNAFLLRLCVVVTEVIVIALAVLCCVQMVIVVSGITMYVLI